jgi:F-type H+-transporting ATPase subunit b
LRRIFALVLLAGALSFAQESAEKKSAEAKAAESKAEEDGLMVWKWANFVLLVGGLGFLILRTVPAMLETRSSEITRGISEAQKVKQEADKRAADVEVRLSGFGSEIEAFKVQAKLDMERESSRIQQETLATVKKLEAQAAAEIESAGKAARAGLKQYAAQLALDLAAKRIEAGLDAGSEAALADNFITDLTRQGSKN